ncbi:MAG: hypothetical protein Q9164_006400 [Protoblastenia rupestris]
MDLADSGVGVVSDAEKRFAFGRDIENIFLLEHPLDYSMLSSWSQHQRRRLFDSQRHPLDREPESFRKQLKDEQKKKRLEKPFNSAIKDQERAAAERQGRASKWQLTVGIEVHAQLNTYQKLFSEARASSEDEPNTNVAAFDLALPGTQPVFQKATLVPALRAAIALRCQIQRKSKFDRKHYFYQDQPNGYQITQYYEPYALDGHILLTEEDGLKYDPVKIGIKQIQMEQDTAKSTMQGSSTALLDFNRVGHPLVEIITLPDIHSPQAAAACVRKIQSTLQAVNAVTIGMELGGLRADVNVSVAPLGSNKLGKRVEIKNLSTFQSIEAAITAEQNRQISILESGGQVEGETRGWSLGSVETTRLRGKEGEVDYRYMPDPDIAPLIIDEDLIEHMSSTLPPLTSEIVEDLVSTSGLTLKDARTLATLDGGKRLDYFDDAREEWRWLRATTVTNSSASFKPAETPHPSENHISSPDLSQKLDTTLANWVLHEIGALLSSTSTPKPFSPALIPPHTLASLLHAFQTSLIDRTTAKSILAKVFNGDERDINDIIRCESSRTTMSQQEYEAMAEEVISANPRVVEDIRVKGKMGKVQGLIGLMRRLGKVKGIMVDPRRAEEVLRVKLKLPA